MGGDPLTMSAEDAAVTRSNPRSDDAFQRLLLKFSDAAAQGTPAQELIRLFLSGDSRILSSGWRLFLATGFRRRVGGSRGRWGDGGPLPGTRVKASQSSVAIAAEAIRQQKTVYENQLDPAPLSHGGGVPRPLDHGRAAGGEP